MNLIDWRSTILRWSMVAVSLGAWAGIARYGDFICQQCRCHPAGPTAASRLGQRAEGCARGEHGNAGSEQERVSRWATAIGELIGAG